MLTVRNFLQSTIIKLNKNPIYNSTFMRKEMSFKGREFTNGLNVLLSMQDWGEKVQWSTMRQEDA